MSDEPILGGFVISRPAPIPYKQGGSQGFRLMSDLHLGAPNVDLKLLRSELDEAKKAGDRILINGDLWDLVLTKDHKRFSGTCLHPRLHGRNDIINEAIKWAIEILSPYSNLIDVIGMGNHETVIEKYSNIDPTKILVYELNRASKTKNSRHNIHYGGYMGFVDYRFREACAAGKNYTAKGNRWVLYYYHGSGGSAPVTRGMIDFARKDVWVGADCIWIGHKHNRFADHTQRIECPQCGDRLVIKDVRHVMTGAYFDTYTSQSQSSIMRHGRRSNYAADGGLAPQGKGGARVALKFLKSGYEVRVTQ
jgi:hypothetical protein